MKRAITSILITAIVIIAILIPCSAASIRQYSDIKPGSWYYEGTQYVLSKEYMIGTDSKTFSPDVEITRAQAAQVLYAMAQRPKTGVRVYTDAKDGSWYSKAVSFGDQEGFFCGFPDNTFRPNDPISREQLITMLYATCYYFDKSKDINTKNKDKLDVSEIRNYAKNAMKWAYSWGLIVGTDKGLVPQASITRAQMALIIKKYETVVPKQIYESKNQHSPFLTMKSASGDYKVSGAGSWETTSGWGEEALLPSATADSVLVGGRIPSKSQSFSLYWDALPDSITIKRWSIDSAGNEQASPIEELTINSPYSIVLDKNSIYELKAVWSEAQYKERGFHGTITYQFVTADY